MGLFLSFTFGVVAMENQKFKREKPARTFSKQLCESCILPFRTVIVWGFMGAGFAAFIDYLYPREFEFSIDLHATSGTPLPTLMSQFSWDNFQQVMCAFTNGNTTIKCPFN